MRAVVDTNIVVRALIKPGGSVGPVLGCLRDGRYEALYSQEILEELVDVLARPRLRDKYSISDDLVESILKLILWRGEEIRPSRSLAVCRDLKNDKFLEVAVDGNADVIVSGDNDLLVLNPFEGIAIVPPVRFLEMLGPR